MAFLWFFFSYIEYSFYERNFFYTYLTKKLWYYRILAFFFLAHSFMNQFCSKFLWKLTLWRSKFFIKSSMTSKVNKGHKQWPFYLKIHFFFCLCYWLKKQMPLNVMKEQSLTYSKTTVALFDLYLCSYGQLFLLVFFSKWFLKRLDYHHYPNIEK